MKVINLEKFFRELSESNPDEYKRLTNIGKGLAGNGKQILGTMARGLVKNSTEINNYEPFLFQGSIVIAYEDEIGIIARKEFGDCYIIYGTLDNEEIEIKDKYEKIDKMLLALIEAGEEEDFPILSVLSDEEEKDENLKEVYDKHFDRIFKIPELDFTLYRPKSMKEIFDDYFIAEFIRMIIEEM